MIETIRADIAYDQGDGSFVWKKSRRGTKAGDPAGSLDRKGYRVIRLYRDGETRLLFAHHIAWLLVHGTWPESEIDHVNGSPADNRAVNLRSADRNQNMRNLRRSRANTSGATGVAFYPPCQKWRVKIRAEGRHMHIGLFDTKEEAIEARHRAEVRLHGDFAASLGAQREVA